jgi:hypothetical protein
MTRENAYDKARCTGVLVTAGRGIRRRGLTRSIVIAGARLDAIRCGCNCQREYVVWHEGVITHCMVNHDEWCQAVLGETLRP